MHENSDIIVSPFSQISNKSRKINSFNYLNAFSAVLYDTSSYVFALSFVACPDVPTNVTYHLGAYVATCIS